MAQRNYQEGRIRQNNKPAYLLISLISPILSLPCGFYVHKIGNFEVLDERESRSGSFKIKGEFFFKLVFDFLLPSLSHSLLFCSFNLRGNQGGLLFCSCLCWDGQPKASPGKEYRQLEGQKVQVGQLLGKPPTESLGSICCLGDVQVWGTSSS